MMGLPYSTARPADALFYQPVPIRSDGRRFQLYEYVYYVLIVYSLFGATLSLSIGMLGAAMHVGLAMLCVLRVRSRIFSMHAAVFIPLLCVVSFVSVQLFVHSESLADELIRPLVIWAMDLIIVKSLCTRPGFIRRASTAVFIIGLMLLAFMNFSPDGRAELNHRAQLGLSNANDLAAWFGFCALAFTIRGFEAARGFRKWISWTAAFSSVLVLALTVSRGPLVALAVCVIIVFRKHLNRSLLPILAVTTLAAAAMAFGVFDHVIEQYAERGMEETGRFVIWPQALARIWKSPVVGVGVSRILTPYSARMVLPHNGFLFIMLASGAVPLFFFCLYWLISLRGALKGSSQLNLDSAYLLPLWLYAFMSLFEIDQVFMTAWSIISVSVCLPHSGFRHRREIQSGNKRQLKDGGKCEFVASRL
jgi:O-antigen ligase